MTVDGFARLLDVVANHWGALFWLAFCIYVAMPQGLLSMTRVTVKTKTRAKRPTRGIASDLLGKVRRHRANRSDVS